MRLVGQRNEDFEEWLGRSLICTAEEPRDLATLSSAIMDGFGQCSKISALSSFKFLSTLPTKEGMIEALAHQEELQQWFLEIKNGALRIIVILGKCGLTLWEFPPPWLEVGKFQANCRAVGKTHLLGKVIIQH